MTPKYASRAGAGTVDAVAGEGGSTSSGNESTYVVTGGGATSIEGSGDAGGTSSGGSTSGGTAEHEAYGDAEGTSTGGSTSGGTAEYESSGDAGGTSSGGSTSGNTSGGTAEYESSGDAGGSTNNVIDDGQYIQHRVNGKWSKVTNAGEINSKDYWVPAGTMIEVVLTGKGKYKDCECSATITCNSYYLDLSNAKVSLAKNFVIDTETVYDLTPADFSLSIKKTGVPVDAYTIESYYKKNKKKVEVTFTATGKAANNDLIYSGTIKKTFDVKKKKSTSVKTQSETNTSSKKKKSQSSSSSNLKSSTSNSSSSSSKKNKSNSSSSKKKSSSSSSKKNKSNKK